MRIGKRCRGRHRVVDGQRVERDLPFGKAVPEFGKSRDNLLAQGRVLHRNGCAHRRVLQRCLNFNVAVVGGVKAHLHFRLGIVAHQARRL